MRKALLIADGRPDDDPSELDVFSTQRLIEKYPVILSRHFMIRVTALMTFILNNDEIFGGKVVDFWWRREFQNRGSPHLHMVLWIKDHPAFDTPEGLQRIDHVCSCSLPLQDSELLDLIKKLQMHLRHDTCKKNTPNSSCRFGFPRPPCAKTRMVDPQSRDFIANGGRYVNLNVLAVKSSGNAGTGKTFLFKLLKNQIDILFSKGKSVVKVCALTGVAARLVGEQTLHSALKLPVQKDGKNQHMSELYGNHLRIMRQQWRDIEFLFIDEISMVPYEMLKMIEARLQQLKTNNVLFGGINIIFFGDLMQLPPIRGNQVFDQPIYMRPATHLWKMFTLVELQDNMRQQGDNRFVDVLNALRVGEMEKKHITCMLGKLSTEKDLVNEFAIGKALRIYPTNEQVDKHNNSVIEFFKKNGTKIYKIKAQDKLLDNPSKSNKLKNLDINNFIPTDLNKTSIKLEVFRLKFKYLSVQKLC
jgi:hypothetical protein